MRKIPFRIVGIVTEKFTLEEGKGIGDRVDVSTNFGFAVNHNKRLVKCTVSYAYSYEGESLLNMVLSCIFAIEPTAFADMQRDNKFVIEPFFSQYLATINVGAARGEIHARCELAKSQLTKIILPPINLVDALPTPIVIDL